MASDMQVHVNISWPQIYFGDGYYAEIKRGPVAVDNGTAYKMIIIPESAICERYHKIKDEYERKGYVEVKYPKEMIRQLCMDPASPRFKCYCTVTNEDSPEMEGNKELWAMVRHLQRKVDTLTWQLIEKEDELKLILTDKEAYFDRIKSMVDRFKSRDVYNQQYEQQTPEDYGGSGQ